MFFHRSLRLLQRLNGKDRPLIRVSTVTALKWVRVAAINVQPLDFVSSSDIVMIDEAWHFVNGKKQSLDLDGALRQPLGW